MKIEITRGDIETLLSQSADFRNRVIDLIMGQDTKFQKFVAEVRHNYFFLQDNKIAAIRYVRDLMRADPAIEGMLARHGVASDGLADIKNFVEKIKHGEI
jgi:rRNA processing protein Krr1/Pno1